MPERTIDDATSALLAGDVIGIPTDTVYGLAGRSSSVFALRRIFELKGRPQEFALPVLVSDLEQAAEVVGTVDPRFLVLGERFWPGALTVVVRPEHPLAAELGGDGTTVGIRCPNNGVVRLLCAEVGPLAVTSANSHGSPPAKTASDVKAAFDGKVDLVLDGGLCDRQPSTVISLVGATPTCLRVGEISFEEIIRAL